MRKPLKVNLYDTMFYPAANGTSSGTEGGSQSASWRSALHVILKYQLRRLRMGVKRFILKTVVVLVGTLLICDYLGVISLKPLKDFVERNLVILAAICCLLFAALIYRAASKRKEGANSGAG